LIVKMAFAAIALLAFARMGLCAQQVLVPMISGQLFADGRPVDRIVEVRLEGQDQSLAGTAFTFGSSRFTFRNVVISLDQNYSLFIRAPGFKELRHHLTMNDFMPDSASTQIYHFGGSITLNLESLPPEQDDKSGPKVVDAKQLAAKVPDRARREYDLGLRAAAAGDSREAMAHLEKAVELAPDFYDALNKLGVEYLRVRQYRKAESILGKARALNPNDPLPLTNLGILHLQEGESLAVAPDAVQDAAKASYGKAVGVFEKVIALGPLSPRVGFYLGTALYRLGEYERAESVLIKTLSLDSMVHEARLTLVSIYTRQKRYKEALEQINAYLEANPDSPQSEKLEDLKTQIESALAPGAPDP